MPKRKPATDTRSAITGKFVPKAKATTDPATTVTTRRKERVPCWAVRHVSGRLETYSTSWSREDARLVKRAKDKPENWRVVKVFVEVVE